MAQSSRVPSFRTNGSESRHQRPILDSSALIPRRRPSYHPAANEAGGSSWLTADSTRPDLNWSGHWRAAVIGRGNGSAAITARFAAPERALLV
jgi:hypothetical protein